jgi:hypothetical protein
MAQPGTKENRMSAAANVLMFPVAETEAHCGECGKGIDPDRQIALFCPECETWTCKSCELCDCDRQALLIQRSLNRLNPSLWTRIRRWFNYGV